MQGRMAWLKSLAIDFLETDANRMSEKYGDEKMWDTPVVGFAFGADDIFNRYKTPEICGIEHWTPAEAFVQTYPDNNASTDELTVVS